MKLLDKLETARKTWKNVIVFDNHEEATEAGFRILYEDALCGGTVYGKPKGESGFLWYPGVVFHTGERV